MKFVIDKKKAKEKGRGSTYNQSAKSTVERGEASAFPMGKDTEA